MTLQTIALVSQIVAAAAVFASLIFVGRQIREQANATRAQTEQAIAANWITMAQVMGATADPVAAGLISESSTFSDLSDADRMRFLTTIHAFFKHYENMYLQFQKGRIADSEWQSWSSHLVMFFHQPGVQSWWALRKTGFSPGFRDFLDRSTPPATLAPSALHEAYSNKTQKLVS